jgi:FHA domain
MILLTAKCLLKDLSGKISYPLDVERSLILGREPGCDIVINEQQFSGVSRRHAELRPIGKTAKDSPLWQICDLKSANGTYLNGQRIYGCQQLNPSDRIQLDQYGPTFVFESESVNNDAASPQPAARTRYNPMAQQDQAPGLQSSSVNPSPMSRIPWKVVGGVAATLVALYFVTRPQPTPQTPSASNPPQQTVPQNSVATGGLQLYTDPNNLFQLLLPSDAIQRADDSQSGNVDITWGSQSIPTINAIVYGPLTNQVPSGQLPQVLQNQIRKWYGSKSAFDLDQPQTLAENSARIFFRYDSSEGKRIGIAGILQHGDKLGFVIVITPQAQVKQVSQQMIDIVSSFGINAAAQVP